MRPQDLYRRQQLQTVPAQGEVVAVFEELVRAVIIARRAISDGQLELAHVRLLAAQRVLAGLRTGLAPEPAELVSNLSALYVHCESLLGRANMQKSVEDIDAALAVLSSLRNTWQEASNLLHGIPAGDAQATLK